MANSLQDQLLKAGAINKQKANQVKAEKRKKNKQNRQAKTQVDAEKLAIQKAQAEKALKDKQLNQQKQQLLQSKAIDAQIQQLIETHSIQLNQDQNDDIAYHFQVGNTVKTIYVNPSLRTQLSDGKMAIIKFDNRYIILPVSVAEKTHELKSELLIIINQPGEDDADSIDGYEGYDVPSDLIW
ncbi:MAG: DUF2058 domain-containing protein [Gammaproteobacteria bacterium]|nr:DUF2058 domain-containing protein [Gammaproteobacteria bacterium]